VIDAPRPPRWVLIALLSLFYGLLLVSAWNAYDAAVDYESATLTLTDRLDFDDATRRKLLDLWNRLSFGHSESYREDVAELQELRTRQAAAQARGLQYTTLFFLLTTLMTLLAAYTWRRIAPAAYVLLAASLPALAVGLAAPALMVVAQMEIGYLGQVVFQATSKGVLTSIGTLLERGNALVALLLTIFSVILPLFKTLVLLSTGAPRIRD